MRLHENKEQFVEAIEASMRTLLERVQKDMTTLAAYVKTKRKEFGLTQEDMSMSMEQMKH